MQNFKETRLIHCYDVVSFVIEIEKAVKDGFSLDLKNNEHYPQQIGWQYITTMVREFPEEVKPVVEDPVEEVKTLKEASESTQEGAERPQRGCDLASTQEVTKEVVEAPKRGRKAKE